MRSRIYSLIQMIWIFQQYRRRDKMPNDCLHHLSTTAGYDYLDESALIPPP